MFNRFAGGFADPTSTDRRICKQGTDCPVPTAHTTVGKGCPAGGPGCLNANRAYDTLDAAWTACGTVSGCGNILSWYDGKFYLRRTTDPSVPWGQGYDYNCSPTDVCNVSDGGSWKKGNPGQNCNQVCTALGQTCDAVKQTCISTQEEVERAFTEAGYTCASTGGSRSYEGAPFSTGRAGDDCYWFQGDATSQHSVCTGNRFAWHSPLCYCK